MPLSPASSPGDLPSRFPRSQNDNFNEVCAVACKSPLFLHKDVLYFIGVVCYENLHWFCYIDPSSDGLSSPDTTPHHQHKTTTSIPLPFTSTEFILRSCSESFLYLQLNIQRSDMCNHNVGHAGLRTKRGGHIREFYELRRIGYTITHCHYRRNNACSAARISILLLQVPNTLPLPCIQQVLHSLVFACAHCPSWF
jgi:hypothetical protein